MIMALMLPNLTIIGILIDFKINQDFIAEEHCINKDKPISDCNGKCYLSEQLKKAQEQEDKKAPAGKKERLEIIYYYSSRIFDFSSVAYHNGSKLNPACTDEFYTFSFKADIFRPPKLNLISLI
ncbi:MAG: hypothetical protein ACOCYO_04560 [Bacteroidota bacterium]